jgi:hypothetical protein
MIRADGKQAQTPQQRKANEKFKKSQDAKRGKPASEIKKKEDFKSPISPLWLGMLSFPFPLAWGVYTVGKEGKEPEAEGDDGGEQRGAGIEELG